MTEQRILLIAVFLMLMLGCRDDAPPTPTTTPQAVPTVGPVIPMTPAATAEDTAVTPAPGSEEPLYLAVIWHQHQPVYFQDPDSGVYQKPWVRLHAAKDYVDMAAILEQYPDVHVTFNLTPSLIRQLDSLAAGSKDLYQIHAEIPAADLSVEQKQFILDRFFDTNRKIIARFPRYQELLDLRDSSQDPLAAYGEEDFRDLQLLFNLAWTDPDWLAQAPLNALVEKGESYTEEDKAVVFAEHLRLIQEVIPLHRGLQDRGQIEVTMTPFAHPILPLLVNTGLARQALPDINLPDPFVYGQDAQAQVELGVALYEDHFGTAPRGMWPAEGSVAQEIVTMVARNGIQWIASDEGVLANSLGMDSFSRDSAETVLDADMLYRPYLVQGTRGGPVAILFRDVVISDKVGFTYSGLEPEVAAKDFVDRLYAIRNQLRESGAAGPHLVSVILDGENAWEHYDNDGKEFLHNLYSQLSNDPMIQTVTPTEFLALSPEPSRIDNLWAGSWISHDFSTWIGEDEENRAWNYLGAVRAFLQPYLAGAAEAPSAAALDEATSLMYIAEGSDWFWWYGSDQNSGDDRSFDEQFRRTLQGVYLALDEAPPAFLDVPIIPEEAVDADIAPAGLISPTIDGLVGESEWAGAGRYIAEGGVMGTSEPVFETIDFGFNGKNLFVNVTFVDDAAEILSDGYVDLYLSVPGSDATGDFSDAGSLLGFPANRLVRLGLEGETARAAVHTATASGWDASGSPVDRIAANEENLELALPLDQLASADSGAHLLMRLFFAERVEAGETTTLVDGAVVPAGGPGIVVVPDLGNTTLVLTVEDPAGDDHGPGSYTYPEDAVFSSGNFDVTNFQVGYDDENVIFKFSLNGPIDNVWDSPNGLSVQTLDVYISRDGDSEGGKVMLPGRNLSFADGYAWDVALSVEGWTSGIYEPGEEGPQRVAESSEFTVIVDPGQQQVTIRVPKSLLGDNPADWQYAAAVLGQEGFPSSGVLRVRDVGAASEQWRFGGAPAGSNNHTRVIDLVWPEAGRQESWLASYSASDAPQAELTAADFATVPMLEAQ